ncbi:MAG: pirin family protein, partial [Candidatus Nucleicultricaceae bacterium]
MITVRRASERGLTDLKWLKSYHSFSFGGYYNPRFMGYESLRVFNEDFVNEGGGFPEHQHANMEIFSYVVSGALEHKDNLGQSIIIQENCFQRMSAGTGIMHSEYNPDEKHPVHFLQFWVMPRTLNTSPSYEQKYFNPTLRRGRLQLIACESE